MEYHEVTIHTNDSAVEYLTAFLLNRGIRGTSVESASVLREILDKKHPYDWDYVEEELIQSPQEETLLRFYLPVDPAGDRCLSELKLDLMKLKSDEQYGTLPKGVALGRLYVQVTSTDDSAWKENWKDHFTCTRLTKSIEACATGVGNLPAEAPIRIYLDPGMAFGTGTHETTSLCAELMEEAGCKGQVVFDIGCGTGILSMAAAKLGASRVIGVDLDPEAVKTALRNVRANNLEDIIEIRQGDLTEGIWEQADLAVANLVAGLVIDLAGTIKNRLREHGRFISSGILLEHQEAVVSALTKNGFVIEKILQKGDWCAISAR